MPRKAVRVDWLAVERLICNSIEGGHLSAEDLRRLQAAHRLAPGTYGELHARLKGEIVERIRRSGA